MKVKLTGTVSTRLEGKEMCRGGGLVGGNGGRSLGDASTEDAEVGDGFLPDAIG